MDTASGHAAPRLGATTEVAARAARPRPSGGARVDPRSLSTQAVRLHALGVIASIEGGSAGLLSRHVAERLAEQAGALVSEVVDAGLWIEYDTCFQIRIDALAEDAWGSGTSTDP